jgi:peroxiredoxin
MNLILSLVTAVCLWTLASASVQGADETGLTPLEDRPQAPGFDLVDPAGKRVRLVDYLGKPVIINFWATWCPPCRAEMPSMQRAWRQLREEGIGLMAVNVGESAGAINRFTEEYPVEFPLPMDVDSEVVQVWPVRGLPTTFVVDPEGRIAFKAAGERDWDDPALLDPVRALKLDD